MTRREDALVIVYQFGKVASTSLVNTLNTCPGIDAHQSHFLGSDALQRIVPIAVDKSTNDYFHEHLAGQFLSNLRLTHKMNKALAGQMSNRLRVISLTREPLDWLRSGIVQDIEGYRGEIVEFARDAGIEAESERVLLREGLARILRRVADIIAAKGGIEAVLSEFLASGGTHILDDLPKAKPRIVRRIFFLAIRPLVWFDEHFSTCFGVALEEFEEDQWAWRASIENADFMILRYEDLASNLEPAMRKIGIELKGSLKRDNVSRTKPYAEDVLAAFQTKAAEDLHEHLKQSEYARQFRYAPVKDALRPTG